MAIPRSGALVVFGVSGDLAHKQVIPALYAMVKRGVLNVPIIGVAFPKWSMDRIHRRVTDSIERSGGIDNKRAFQQLLSLIKYVSGDYKDPATFAAIKQALGNAKRPAFYLAIPPSLFETVIEALGAAKLNITKIKLRGWATRGLSFTSLVFIDDRGSNRQGRELLALPLG